MKVKDLERMISDVVLVPANELPRVLFHGVVLSIIISGFWLLDSLKDPILSNTIGIEYQPLAKVFSVFTTLLVVSFYDYITVICSKPLLFHIVSWFYGILFMVISAVLSNESIGLSSKAHNPLRMIGWIAYFAVESYGSLIVSLFWSFTNTVMNLEEAKGSYGLIIAIAQVGAILGSTVATNADKYGISQLFIIGSMTVISVSLFMKVYFIVYKKVPSVLQASLPIDYDHDEYLTDKKSSTICTKIFRNFNSGFLIIIRYPYTLKILAVTCLYEIVVTVIDYKFKILGAFHSSTNNPILASTEYNSLEVNEKQYANLLGHFGQVTNGVSLLISIFGFSMIVKWFGVKYSLMIFPTILFFVVILTNLYPTLNVLFVSVSIIKALIFSLHDPVKELLYIPTTDAVKLKAKAWIDVFGSRFAKAIGSLMTNQGGSNVNKLRNISEIPCLLISIFLLVIAWSAGDEFEILVEKNEHFRSKQSDVARNGKMPGEVGYDGYDLHLFEGVFDELKPLEEED